VITSLGDKARAEVDSVLKSALFVRSPRLAHLLEYLCTKYFAGESDQIKEYHIAVEVLDRPESFDPTADAIARVEVHRLRKKLREYYETEGTDHPLRIVIPTGHYAPIFMSAAQAEENAAAANGSAKAQVAGAANGSRAASQTGVAVAPRRSWPRIGLLMVAVIVVCALVFSMFQTRGLSLFQTRPRAASLLEPIAANSAASLPSIPTFPPHKGDEVRLLCGQRNPHTDRLGRLWDADRYFEGGDYSESSVQLSARTIDPWLFQGGRTGDFSYRIPLRPGVYELHLYFAETTYGPGMSGG
jgi:hypothetical protein